MRQDIKHSADGDIDLSSGDILYDGSPDQHKKDIVVADKGYYKQHPDIGVGMINYLHDNNPENMLRAIRKECARDGMRVQKVGIVSSGIQIVADYEDNNG